MVPLVSALMITGKCPERLPMARVAVRRFLAQDWPRKELVIINHGAESVLASCVQTDIETDRFTRLNEVKIVRDKETLGELRTLSKNLAIGDYCVHWDDDDYLSDDYISYCMANTTDKLASVLRTQLRFGLHTGASVYVSLPNGHRHPCYFRKTAPDYPKIDIFEDAHFIAKIRRYNVLDNPWSMYVRTFHGHNVLGQESILVENPDAASSVLPIHLDYLAKIREEYFSVGVMPSLQTKKHG